MFDHCGIIDENLNVWVFGDNGYGQLGLGDKINRLSPEKVENLPPIVSVSIGGNYMLFLDSEGYVWISGEYQNRKLVNPEKIPDLEHIVKMDSGHSHCLFLDHNGNVLSCGGNKFGQLGLGDTIYRDEPTKIEAIPIIKDICCGYNYSILIDEDGNCWSFGNNFSGQLGLGQKLCLHDLAKTPTKIDGLPSIRAVSAGYAHTILIDINDNIYFCGCNNMRQLGFNEREEIVSPTQFVKLPKIKSAYCGDDSTIVIDVNGDSWGFGYSNTGQFGQDHPFETLGKLIFPFDVNSFVCFRDSTIIITSEGYCYGCGHNNKGQLGLGHTLKCVRLPIKIELPIKVNLSESKRFKKTKNARSG